MRSAAILARSAGANSFNRAAYTSPNGAIIVPANWGQNWYPYRDSGAAIPRDVVAFGDSTMYGSEGAYSIVSRLRDRSTSYGLPDGGKGIFAAGESEMVYDAPEVNGIVSNGWDATVANLPDSWDTLVGQYLYDTGTGTTPTAAPRTLSLQFRATGLRLWYIKRGNAGDFTYSIDGGAPVTVHAGASVSPLPTYVVVTGLAPNTTHTLAIVNAAGTAAYIAVAPINASGPRFQKQATSGATFGSWFLSAPPERSFRYQAPLGLLDTVVSAPTFRGAPADTTHPANERINPVLAMTNLGFNDLTNATSGNETAWVEYVKRFAGLCADAGCDGLIIAGQLPYNASWPTYGASRFAALRDTAAAMGLAFVDSFYPIGGPSLSYAGTSNNPHLQKAQYQAQADFIWDGLLAR